MRPPTFDARPIVLIALLALVCVGCLPPKPEKRSDLLSLETRRALTELEALTGVQGLKRPLPDGRAVLITTLGGNYTGVLAIGRPGKSEQIGELVERAFEGFETVGEVRRREGTDESTASATWRLPARKFEPRTDLVTARVRNALESDGFGVTTLVRYPLHAVVVNGSQKPLKTGSYSWLLWHSAQGDPVIDPGSIGFKPLVAALNVFLPLIVVGSVAIVMVRISKDTRRSLETRRDLLTHSTFFLMVFGLLTVWFSITMWDRSLAVSSTLDYLYASDRTGFLALFALIHTGSGLGLLSLSFWVPAKILGQTRQEADAWEQVPRAKPKVGRPIDKRHKAANWILMLVGFTFLALVEFRSGSIRSWVFLAYLVLTAILKIGGPEKLEIQPRTADERVQRIAESVAQKLGMAQTPKIRIVQGEKDDRFVSSSSSFNGTVILSAASMDTLSDQELEALLTHEFVHVKGRHALIRKIVVATPFLLLMVGTVIVRRLNPLSSLDGLGILFGITMGLAALVAYWLGQTHEKIADRSMALNANPEAIASLLDRLALQRSVQMSKPTPLWWWHAWQPNRRDRVERIASAR